MTPTKRYVCPGCQAHYYHDRACPMRTTTGSAPEPVVAPASPLVATIGYGPCAVCGGWGYTVGGVHADCALRVGFATVVAPAPAPTTTPTCDCGAATADPVSTRRDGGGGHADYCAVRGRP